MSSASIKELRIEMAGSRPFYDADVRRGVVDALLARPKLTPEVWSAQERGGPPFDYEKVVNYRTGAPDGNTLFLRRKKVIKYDLSMHLHKKAALIMSFDPKTDAKQWPEIYLLAERLADAYQPDILWVRPLLEQTYDAQDERCQTFARMGQVGTVAPIFYRDNGPAGLGFRTVLGPRLIEQVGMDRIASLPPLAITKSLPWGGVSIDLLSEPWARSLDELSDAWRACMQHLEPAGFFAEVALNQKGEARLTRPKTPGWDPGGLVP